MTWERMETPKPPRRRRRISFQTNPGMFESLIKGKRVIIVGPSTTVEECKLGEFIESFDVVIRLNKSLPVPPRLHAHIGARTDILYNSLNQTDYPGENNINPIFLRNNRIRYLRCPYPPITPFKYDMQAFQSRNRGIVPFGHIDHDYYRKMRYSLQTRPYTGTCAIADLLHCGVGELYVMGIDFYTYGYARYYRRVSKKKLQRMRNNNIHKRGPQIDLIKRFYLLDKRLIVDNILDKILLEDYDTLFYNIQSQVEFGKIFISANETYLSPDSSLIQIREKAEKMASKDMGMNKMSICIIGDLDPSSLNTDMYRRFDFIIDLFPDRHPPLPRSADVAAFMSVRDWTPDVVPPDSYTMITQSFRKSFALRNDPRSYTGVDAEKTLFLNPLFAKYLRAILTQTVIAEGKISTEIFLALIFSSFFADVADIYVAHMDPYAQWNLHPADQRQNAISQRMLYHYLLKREVIKIFNETPISE